MKRNSYRLFLEDMLEAINKIERYIQDLTRDQFEGNDLVIDAVIRNLEIIGEAAKNVPEDIKKKYPTIPWNRMIGLRKSSPKIYRKLNRRSKQC
jgi:uncharacterized protein with HEPN domain